MADQRIGKRTAEILNIMDGRLVLGKKTDKIQTVLRMTPKMERDRTILLKGRWERLDQRPVMKKAKKEVMAR